MESTMEPNENDTPGATDAPIPPRNRRERRAAKSAGKNDMRQVRLHKQPRRR